MMRVRIRRGNGAIAVRTRLVVIGTLAALLLLGALNSAPVGALSPTPSEPSDHTSYVVQHAATVGSGSTNPTRSHRLVVAGLVFVTTCLAAMAAQGMASLRRTSRRRVEQFHVLRRGPPPLLVAH
jgi:hypothetical protein